MTDAEILRHVKNSMSEKRFLHTLRCADMAVRLSARWGEDEEIARRAAYLHDIAKEMPYEEQLELIDKFGVILTDTQKSEKIIHAFAGACIAWHEFSMSEEICGAIRWHTTAKRNMSRLEKIIWLADLVEDGRDFPGVERIRNLAFEDLSAALILGFDTTIGFLLKKGKRIDINMIEARNSEIAAGKD